MYFSIAYNAMPGRERPGTRLAAPETRLAPDTRFSGGDMRAITMVMINLCGVVLLGQALTVGLPAPTGRAVDFKLGELEAAGRELAAKGLITERILEGGTYSINVRHIASAETALVHGKITEVWVVREGSGTLATGGSLVDPKPGATSGEQSGSSIRGGVERVINAGDVIFIPPGVPHGIKESKSITYLNIRFETR
jgi:mannose-6-phosphate isomerase-like protein (cupin superfamily)